MAIDEELAQVIGAAIQRAVTDTVLPWLEQRIKDAALEQERNGKAMLADAMLRLRDGRDGRDGKDGVHGKNGLDGKDGADGADGADGVDGKEGAPGKDGIGVKALYACPSEDLCTLELHLILSDDSESLVGALPMYALMGTWEEAKAYKFLNVVQYNGCSWVATKDTPQGQPGESADWKLQAKRGDKGKDAKD